MLISCFYNSVLQQSLRRCKLWHVSALTAVQIACHLLTFTLKLPRPGSARVNAACWYLLPQSLLQSALGSLLFVFLQAYPHSFFFSEESIEENQCSEITVQADSAVHYLGDSSVSASLSTTFTRVSIPTLAYGTIFIHHSSSMISLPLITGLYNRHGALYGQIIGDGIIVKSTLNMTNVEVTLR
jgi:hypothetical protein